MLVDMGPTAQGHDVPTEQGGVRGDVKLDGEAARWSSMGAGGGDRGGRGAEVLELGVGGVGPGGEVGASGPLLLRVRPWMVKYLKEKDGCRLKKNVTSGVHTSLSGGSEAEWVFSCIRNICTCIHSDSGPRHIKYV